jgi:hypothetical protein
MHAQLGLGGYGRVIEVVAESRDARLGALVEETLQGCADAAQWHVRLQVALGQQEAAVIFALATAEAEQLAGNYKVSGLPIACHACIRLKQYVH